MSAFNGLKFTNSGLLLQGKAQTGVELVFTRIGIGDGTYTGSILTLNHLVHEVLSLPISSVRVLGTGQAAIGSALSNADLSVGFYLREIGVYATDPDLGEILYCYANAGVFAGYIPPAGGGDVVEKEVQLITVVGTAPNVTAVINESLVFATMQNVNDAVADMQGSLDAHAHDTNIHVTSSQKTTWSAKQDALGYTPENLANKGTAGGYAGLDNTAKIPTNQLPDSILGQVEYIGTWNASANTPTLPSAGTVKGHYYVVDTAGMYAGIDFKIGDWVISNGVEWQKVDNTDAVPTVFGRTGNIVAANGDYAAEQVSLTSTNFSATNVKGGMDELFTNVSNGKNSIASAITDKGVPASGSDTFPQLSTKIRAIPIGETLTGNAVSGDVRNGKTFMNANGALTGTLPVNPSMSDTQDLTNDSGSEKLYARIATGIYEQFGGSGKSLIGIPFAAIQNLLPQLVPQNIRQGTSRIFGVSGTLVPASGNAVEADLLAGKVASNASGQFVGTMVKRQNAEYPGYQRANAIMAVPGRVHLYAEKGAYLDGTADDPSGQTRAGFFWDDNNFRPENIKSGATVLGIAGTGKTLTGDWSTFSNMSFTKDVASSNPRRVIWRYTYSYGANEPMAMWLSISGRLNTTNIANVVYPDRFVLIKNNVTLTDRLELHHSNLSTGDFADISVVAVWQAGTIALTVTMSNSTTVDLNANNPQDLTASLRFMYLQ